MNWIKEPQRSGVCAMPQDQVPVQCFSDLRWWNLFVVSALGLAVARILEVLRSQFRVWHKPVPV